NVTTGKRLSNKGIQPTSRLTINGRIKLRRRWWHGRNEGSVCPSDRMLFRPEATVSRGVREMACRCNTDASGFEAAAENLERTAQIPMSKEQLRQLVVAEGKRVMAAQEAGTLPPEFQAEDCRVAGEDGE